MKPPGPHRQRRRIAALRALALAAAGDQAAAAQDLAGTLALAAPQGYVRVFADEGPPMAALLAQVAAAHRDGDQATRQVPLGYLAAVLRACAPVGLAAATRPAATRPAGTRPGSQPAIPGLPPPLTARAPGPHLPPSLLNQRTRHDLVDTLDTLKQPITHLLGKLGAANRTEAVTRARQLGLLS